MKSSSVSRETFIVQDLGLAEQGCVKIDWVARWMTVLNGLREQFSHQSIFTGKRVAISIHLEAKTAYLAQVIQDLGAEVWITSSNPHSAKDDVCAALAKRGIHVYARKGADQDEYERFVHEIASCKPHALIDDGGDVTEYLHQHPEFAVELKGVCEETTSGVARLKQRDAEGSLLFPAIAINDAQSKYLFDNRYGTGESTWSAITHLTNVTVAGKTVVCVGFGWVGRGVAMRAAGMGAEVIVTEIDPWKAWEARMEGFRVMPIQEAAPLGDYFITNTGEENVIRLEHMRIMKDGAFLANAGHFGNEIDVPGLNRETSSIQSVRDEIDEYNLRNGKRLYLLAKGSIINISGGLGHPIEIMDLSFSLQLASVHFILETDGLKNLLYRVPKIIDERVVRTKMQQDGIAIDEDLRNKG
ncbi:MAG: adenosylhomocysteinase [bacterium]